MNNAESSHASRPGPSDLRQSFPRQEDAITSIINAEIQGPLFPVLPFGQNFYHLIQEQQESDPYCEYFDNYEQEQEVAERCDVWDDLQDANKFFDDPTLRGLLQMWHEGKLEGRKAPTDKSLRPTWGAVYGQMDEVTEFGDRSNLHLREHPRPPGQGDENVRRLLSASVRGRRRIPHESRIAAKIKAEKKRRLHLEEDTTRERRGVKWGRPHVSAPPIPNGEAYHERSPAADVTSSTDPVSTNNQPETTNALPQPETEEQLDQEDFDLVIEMSAKRAEEEERVGRTPLEDRFHAQSLMVEDSELWTLADESRFEVPVQLRPPMNFIGPEPPRYKKPFVPIMDTEMVVSAALYSALRPTQRTQEYLFLGSQPLTALRDAFYCLSDFVSQGPDEPEENAPTRNRSDKKTSNSFIYIEGVFYTDTPLLRAKIDKRNELREKERSRLEDLANQCRQRRQQALDKRKKRLEEKRVSRRKGGRSGVQETAVDEDNIEDDLDYDSSDLRDQMSQTTYKDIPINDIRLEEEDVYASVSQDYSQLILDWVAENPRRKADPKFSTLKKKYMHDTLIQDLSIRINQPYLFAHQGKCEHILMFRDLRLFNQQHDDLNRLSYPKPVFRTKKIRHRCRMCNTNAAHYITIDDRLAGETPSYFCEECYDIFHYDVDGNILHLRAGWMAQELLITFGNTIGELALIPGKSATFIVRVNGAAVFDRKDHGRFPEMKEVKQLVRTIIAPEMGLGHSDSAVKSAVADKEKNHSTADPVKATTPAPAPASETSRTAPITSVNDDDEDST
ncbi:small nuclear RNA activating complex, polypeptide 3, partial [Mortierella sp. GBA30]